jgi:hypothetical protein
LAFRSSQSCCVPIVGPKAASREASPYLIFINTLFQGRVASVSDNDGYVVFATERDAQLEIADCMMTRLREFIDGHRDFDDATSTEETIVTVAVHPDGTFTTEDGVVFSPTS